MHDSARSACRAALHVGLILALTGIEALAATATGAAAHVTAQIITAAAAGGAARYERAAGIIGVYSEVHLVRHTTVGDVVHVVDSWRWRHDLDASGMLHQRTASTSNTSFSSRIRPEIVVYPPGELRLWSADPPPADTAGFRSYLTAGLVLPGDAGTILARIIDGSGVLCLNHAQRAALHDLVVDLTTTGNGPEPAGVEVRTTTAGVLRYQLSFHRGTGTLTAVETTDIGGNTQPPLRQHIVWLSCRHTDTPGGVLT